MYNKYLYKLLFFFFNTLSKNCKYMINIIKVKIFKDHFIYIFQQVVIISNGKVIK